jgi:CRP-like cAMP-binding protein
MLNSALLAQERGDFPAAVEAYERYLASRPGDVEARRYCADICARIGRKDDAVEHYEILVGALAKAGLGLKAISACCTLLQHDPAHTGTQRALAELVADRNVDPVRVMTAAMKRGASPPDEELEVVAEHIPPGTLALPDLPLFSDLEPDALEELIVRLDAWRSPEAATVIRQGERGSSFFVVVSGVARVERELPTGEREWVSILRAGDFFGEAAALEDLPRTSTVIAQTDLELLELPRPRVEELCAQYPGFERALRRFQRKRQIAHVVATERFAALSEGARRDVLHEFRDVRVPKGEVLIEQGARVRALYIVLAGDLECAVPGRRKKLVEGDLVGARAMISGEPARATLRALSPARLLRLTPDGLERLRARHPDFYATLGA